MDEERVKEIFTDEAFVKELLELETVEEVQTALKEKGIDATESEIVAFRNDLVRNFEKLAEIAEGGELSPDQLDEAAGGLVIGFAGITCAGLGVAVGPTIAVLAGAGLGIGAIGATAMAITGAATIGGAAAIGAIGSAIKNRRW